MKNNGDVYDLLDSFAPFATQLEFDNSGLLVGGRETAVSGIAVCLDITPDAVAFARDNGCSLIVSHHPVIFDKIARIDRESVVYSLIENGISAICAHTNLDAAALGVNDCLARRLGIENAVPPADANYPGEASVARMGSIAPTDAREFVRRVKDALCADGVLYCCSDDEVRKVCVYGGAGHEFVGQAHEYGAQALVTSEIRQHEWLLAHELGLTVVDAGHFYTENVVIQPLARRLAAALDGIKVIEVRQRAPYEIMGI